METIIKYRGRDYNRENISLIKGLIVLNPKDSRYALSVKLCKAWKWVQPNGVTRENPIACMAWSSPPRHIKSRDQFIGWSPDVRMKNLSLIAYNTRFLILPWIRVKHLASRILSQMTRCLSGDWQKKYRHPIFYLETFVDKTLFPGTSYKAANWIYLGDTTGRGKNDQTGKPNRSIKAVWGYPIGKDFREYLCHAG